MKKQAREKARAIAGKGGASPSEYGGISETDEDDDFSDSSISSSDLDSTPSKSSKPEDKDSVRRANSG